MSCANLLVSIMVTVFMVNLFHNLIGVFEFGILSSRVFFVFSVDLRTIVGLSLFNFTVEGRLKDMIWKNP